MSNGQNSKNPPHDSQPGPSPSLLGQVKRYWKENLPMAYAELKSGELEKLVQSAEEQIGLMISQGLSVSGAREMVYPSLFPEPQGEMDEED
jgi:hypothetical protein